MIAPCTKNVLAECMPSQDLAAVEECRCFPVEKLDLHLIINTTMQAEEHAVKEFIEAVTMAYVEYTAPLVNLIEKITESSLRDNRLLPGQLEDYLTEASASTFTIFPLHALLSSFRDTDMGTSDPPSLQFVHHVINENVLIHLRDNIALAASRLMRDYENSGGNQQDIDAAVNRASQAICIELSRIKDLNRGFMPHPDLKELWDRFSCQDDFAAPDLI